MIIFLSILFWVSVFSLFHSYFLYPFLLRWAAKGKEQNVIIYEVGTTELPHVSILLSAYNEVAVMEEKLTSVFNSDYPLEKLHIYIGSDCSDDGTNELIADFRLKYPENIHFTAYTERRGKPKVINDLAAQAATRLALTAKHIFIITDANVFLTSSTIYELAKHFRNDRLALVDSNIQHPQIDSKGGIAKNERGYISREVQIKHWEGLVWETMIGPLGGCYALRSTHFSEVPVGFLVDDFYIAMKAFEKGGKAINEPLAICYEDISNSMGEEFRRKTRISTGNYANLAIFWRLLLPKEGALAYAFFSHKVLRWLGPFFILTSVLTNVGLAFIGTGNLFYQILLLIQLIGIIGIPLVDFILKQFHIHIFLLRYISYFMAMNVALLKGFINYLKGVRNNVWQPTKRNIGKKTG